MTREIKFRAWGTDDVGFPKKMWYFGLANIEHGKLDIASFYLTDSNVMQFTGLLDKNGKEIYEGDIIHKTFRKAPKSPNWRVVFQEGKGRWTMQWNERSVFSLTMVQAREYEIIGNIYETPSLISGESNNG